MKYIPHCFGFIGVIYIACILAGCRTSPPPKQDEEVVVTKVPILGDIPGIGVLFRSVDRRPRKQTSSVDSPANAVPKQAVVPVSQDTNDVPARLKKLKVLKDSGAISEEEYQAQRKVLVEKL